MSPPPPTLAERLILPLVVVLGFFAFVLPLYRLHISSH